MRPKTSPTRRIAISRRPWIAAATVVAAVILLVHTACEDQPDAADQASSVPPAADSDANANPPPSREQVRVPLKAPAEPTERAGARGPERHQQRISRLREERYAKLGLSDEQKKSIEGLRAEQEAWIAEHRDEIRDLGTKRRAALQAGDEAEAEAIRLQVRELRETLPTEQDIAALLTDEQRVQLRQNRPITVKGSPPPRQAPPAADSAPAPL